MANDTMQVDLKFVYEIIGRLFLENQVLKAESKDTQPPKEDTPSPTTLPSTQSQ